MNTCKRLVVALIAIFLLLNVAASATATADAAKDAYQKGKACLDKKDNDAAVLAFTEAIRLIPS